MTNFTKSDLRSGMKVQMRNGQEYIFMQNPDKRNCEFIKIDSSEYMSLHVYSDGLLFKYNNTDWDIVKVFSCDWKIVCLFSNFPSVTWNLVWQRECDHKYACTKCGEALPKPEQKEDKPQEPIKLYCVKDISRPRFFTKGKIYTIDTNGTIIYDNGFKGGPYKSFEVYKFRNSALSACLVPLVKRQAKVGEWVLVTDADRVVVHNGTPDYKNGDILQITERPNWSSLIEAYYKKASGCFLYDNEYLVLDGYQPEPEPEKPNLRSKYEALSNDDLRCESCLLPNCKAQSGRKNDCPLCKYEPPCGIYLTDHPELRDTLIDYLVNENS